MAAATSPGFTTKRGLKVRAPKLAFEGTSKRWMANSRAATHIANGVNLLFPAGERFFIRSVRHYLDRITPELAAEVRGFFGQEGRHAYAHERFFDTLRAQGYDIDSILRRYERVAYDGIEKVSPAVLCLSVTVALEHFTAILAEDALSTDELGHADTEVRRLMEWHAVEELEHKAVAFDVLKQVAPGYGIRVAGMVFATIVLSGFWLFATRELLAQDGSSLREAARELEELRKEAERLAKESGRQTALAQPIATGVFLRGIREYLRPGFHPNDRDHRALIASTLERLNREGVV
ncbi:MAG: metal-dependent hydrolase [Labilithrix sp.]|nr:metal-dependent hydrolase [Labilithrix sp.]MCW5813753.1 metal-dependent hydrolase [Labilithrix sp.]